MSTSGEPGCYLLHFDSKVAGVQHYLGFSKNIGARFKQHLQGDGNGAELTRRAVAAGVKFSVVRIWAHATPEDEKRLKAKKNLPRLCPVCHETRLAKSFSSVLNGGRGLPRCIAG